MQLAVEGLQAGSSGVMRVNRLYLEQPVNGRGVVPLSKQRAHHASKVLRLRDGAPVVAFDGTGGEHEAHFQMGSGGQAQLRLERHLQVERESPLSVVLWLGVSRGERMDYAVQKAVELGVSHILPVVTARTVVRLDPARAARRVEHWRNIVTNACEQCGRNRIPAVAAPCSLDQALAHGGPAPATARWVLSLDATTGLAESMALGPGTALDLLIGPEGGLAAQELAAAIAAGFTALRFGTRTLRTETAAMAALAAIQTLWGDLGKA